MAWCIFSCIFQPVSNLVFLRHDFGNQHIVKILILTHSASMCLNCSFFFKACSWTINILMLKSIIFIRSSLSPSCSVSFWINQVLFIQSYSYCSVKHPFTVLFVAILEITTYILDLLPQISAFITSGKCKDLTELQLLCLHSFHTWHFNCIFLNPRRNYFI